MHAATSFSATGSSKENGGPFPGFDMAYGDNLWYWKHARVGWELGFGLLPINITDNSTLPASVNQLTYTFNTGGIVVPDCAVSRRLQSVWGTDHCNQFQLQRHFRQRNR